MPQAFLLQRFDHADAGQVQAATKLWNSAVTMCLTISPDFMAYNATPTTGLLQEGSMAQVDGEPAGFVLASVLPTEPLASPPDLGRIDALAVTPAFQEQGIGSRLLAWAEEWLAEQGCTTVTLGSSIRPFVPGLPTELRSEAFFTQRGYTGGHEGDEPTHVWDVGANLASYTPPASVREIDGTVRPARAGDEEALFAFLRREFPGRWRYEMEEYLGGGGRLSDVMLLWTERGVHGFCQITFEDSPRPMERYYPYSLPRPWGQLGPIGVSEDTRGRGYGAAVLDAGLRRLRDNGVNGCVIDWTEIVDFYGKFGFTPYREYVRLVKKL